MSFDDVTKSQTGSATLNVSRKAGILSIEIIFFAEVIRKSSRSLSRKKKLGGLFALELFVCLLR